MRGLPLRDERILVEWNYLQTEKFREWAMLGSNQLPLPCEGSTIVCCRFLELANFPQTAVFLRRRNSQLFRRFTRVAARLLHIHLPAVRPLPNRLQEPPTTIAHTARASARNPRPVDAGSVIHEGLLHGA